MEGGDRNVSKDGFSSNGMTGNCTSTLVSGALFGINHLSASQKLPTVILDLECKEAKELDSSTEPGKDIVLVVDVSGSMSGVIPQLRDTVKQVGAQLKPQHRIALVAFDHQVNVLLPLKYIQSVDEVNECADKLAAAGGTDISLGMLTAVDVLTHHKMEETNKRLGVLLLLSDGQPGSGITDEGKLCLAVQESIQETCQSINVIVHSFGFTEHHAATLLQTLTTAGNFGSGMYYYLVSNEDIPSCVGDCLGGLTNICAYDLKVSATPVYENGAVNHVCWFYDGLNVSAMEQECSISLLTLHSKHSFVVVCKKEEEEESKMELENYKEPIAVKLLLSFQTGDKKTTVKQEIICPIETAAIIANVEEGEIVEVEERDTDSPDFLHALTHILRIRGGILLHRLVDPAAEYLESYIEGLHELVLDAMGKVQLLEDPRSLHDEGILVCLERDIGEVLEKFHQSSLKMNQFLLKSMQARLLQMSHEHLHQKAASSSSLLSKSSAYTTPEQLAACLRFLSITGSGKVDPVEEKSKLKVEEPHLTDEQISKRKEMDKIACFITLDDWRSCQALGLGLLVRPRTSRERYRKLIPCTEIVQDYISTEAYNSGVRGMVNNAQSISEVNRDDEETEDKHQTLKSSVRGRINAWLPLYINETNWKFSKKWAPSAFSIIATQFNDLFQPIHALSVCTKLMIQTVVKCLITDAHISERGIQMFCDVHRVLLQMVEEYPEIKSIAETKLKKFINNPHSRIRSQTPDLGDIIYYLTMTEKYTWDDVKEAYVQEAFRRNVRFIGHIPLYSMGTAEELLRCYLEGASAGRVTMFNILFLDVIGRPKGASLSDIRNMYDSRWGRIPDEKLQLLKEGADRILKVISVEEMLENLLGYAVSTDAAAEFMLWSLGEKEETDNTPKYEGIPKERGRRYEHWQWKHECWLWAQTNPPPVIPYLPPVEVTPHCPYDGVIGTIQNVENSSRKCKATVECNCQRCNNEKSRREKLDMWLQSSSMHDSTFELTAFIARLKYTTTEETLRQACAAFGPVKNVVLVRNSVSGQSKGYAFVQFEEASVLQQLLQHVQSNSHFAVDGAEAIVDVKRGGIDPDFTPMWLGGGLGSKRITKKLKIDHDIPCTDLDEKDSSRDV